MKIAIGLSGGVDSAVSAALLQKEGHDVIGVCMKIWDGPSIPQKNGNHACYGPGEDEDIRDADSVAKHLGIPFYVIDCASQYREIVLSDFRTTYINGKTPNPCVLCNSIIKFGILPQLLKKSGVDFDKFATGHYVRLSSSTNGETTLLRGIDPNKDQSYFLYRLSRTILKDLLFPLGGMLKSEVRLIAKKLKLPVSNKQESQDFYEGDYAEIITSEGTPITTNGAIVDISGKTVGNHTGIWNYTIGQRKGLGISFPEPRYVIGIDASKNQITIGPKELLFKKTLVAHSINLLTDQIPEEFSVKIRSSSPPIVARISERSNDTIAIELSSAAESVTPGQSMVMYDNDRVLGGGIIDYAV